MSHVHIVMDGPHTGKVTVDGMELKSVTGFSLLVDADHKGNSMLKVYFRPDTLEFSGQLGTVSGEAV